MRRNRSIEFASFFLSAVILLNLFAGSVWCVFLISSNGEIGCSVSGMEDKDNEPEWLKISIEISNSSSGDFRRMNDREIVYEGKLYDVVKSYEKDGFRYYYGTNDSNEEKILEQVRQCTEAHLDYFDGRNHSTPPVFKLFVQENSVSQKVSKEFPETHFTFLLVNEIFQPQFFFREIYPPPETQVS